MLTKQLNKIASKIADPDIPNREPDVIKAYKTKLWYLDQNCSFSITPDGEKRWLKNGVLHREDGPAVINPNGNEAWYLNGQPHREDGPAIEEANGAKEWYLNGRRHRKDGPAVEYPDAKVWYLNGRRHREDGPAVEYANGTKEWYLNGKLHREDGPAVEDAGGAKEWYLNGNKIKSKDYNSSDFQERWKKLVELERVRQVMED